MRSFTTTRLPNRSSSESMRGNAPSSSPLLETILTTAVLAVGILAVVGFYAMSIRPGAPERWVLAAALIMPAMILASRRSTLLLDYFLVVVVINRELRRMLDWGEGRYDPTPILSLLPLLIAFLMIFTVVANWHRLSIALRRAAGLLIAALIYALVIGFSRYGPTSLYACAEYVTPLLVLYYCVACRPTAEVLQRWLIVLATLGILAGVYGIIQWIVVPEWDATWLVWSGMNTSMGNLQAYGMSIASTLESRGPAAIFFAVTTSLFIALPTFRRRGGIVLAAIPATALLLTRARTGLVYLVLSLLVSSYFARGSARVKIILAMCITAAITVGFLGKNENSTVIFDRVATLADIQSDGSANTRINIADQGIGIMFRNPIGFGFGSAGTAVRTGAGEQDAVGDNGYLEILTTLGIPGTALYAAGLLLIVRLALRQNALATGKEATTHLGLGMLVALAPILMIGNCLTTAHASYVWIILSRHLSAMPNALGQRRRAKFPVTTDRPYLSAKSAGENPAPS